MSSYRVRETCAACGGSGVIRVTDPNGGTEEERCPDCPRLRDTEAATCRHPDRDVPKLMCGYPLPCPHHTAIIDTTVEPPTVTIPVTSDAMKLPARARLGEIGRALAGRVVVKRPKKRSEPEAGR